MMAILLREVVDGIAVRSDIALESPVLAKNVLEKHFAGTGGDLVDGVVSAHDGVSLAFGDGGAECGQVSVPEVVFAGIDVNLMAGGFRPAVHRVMLGCGDGAEVFRVVALNALYERNAHAAGEERVFAVGLLAASPAGIAKEIYIWRPDGKPGVKAMVAVQDGVVILRACVS